MATILNMICTLKLQNSSKYNQTPTWNYSNHCTPFHNPVTHGPKNITSSATMTSSSIRLTNIVHWNLRQPLPLINYKNVVCIGWQYYRLRKHVFPQTCRHNMPKVWAETMCIPTDRYCRNNHQRKKHKDISQKQQSTPTTSILYQNTLASKIILLCDINFLCKPIKNK